jgi:two-component system, response regulator YesN
MMAGMKKEEYTGLLQHMNSTNRKKSVLFSWALSHALILAIPLVLSVAIFINSLDTYKKSLDKADADTVRQLQNAYDGYLEEVQKVCVQIETNESLGQIMYAAGVTDITKSYTTIKRVLDLNRDLNGYAFPGGLVSGVMIALRKSDVVLFDSTVFTREEWVTRWLPDDAAATGLQAKLFDTPAEQEFCTLPVPGGGSGMALIHSIPELSGDPQANVIIYIAETKFMQAAALAQRWPGALVEIVDGDGHTVFTTGSSSFYHADPASLHFSGRQGRIAAGSGKNKLSVSFARSSVTGWTYLLEVPSSVYTSKFTVMRGLLIAGFLFYLLLEGCTVFIALRLNYAPLRRLLEMTGVRVAGFRAENEYEMLDRSLRKLKSQDEAMRAHFFQNLISGRTLNRDSIMETAQSLNVHFSDGAYVVVLAFYDPDSTYFAEHEFVTPGDWFDFHRTIENLAAGTFDGEGQLWETEYAEMSAFIINLTGSAGGREPRIRACLESVRCKLESMGIITFLSCGDIHPLVVDIPRSFHEAMDTMEHRLLAPTNAPLLFSDVFSAPNKDFSYGYTFDSERILTNLLGNDDTEQAWNAVEQLLDGLVEQKIDVETARCLLYDLIGTIIKTLIVHNVTIGNDDQVLVQSVMTFKNLPELRERLHSLITWAGNRIRAEREKRSESQAVHLIKEEIEQHYGDRNLNVATLALKAGMNPKYVSALYKSQQGESMLDTIHHTRILHAKELLAHGTAGISEIAVAVGYNGSNALIRAFKDYEGITPGQYKKAHE